MSERYTLSEAAKEMNKRECAAHGHDWQHVLRGDGGVVRLYCYSCGWTAAVEMGERP